MRIIYGQKSRLLSTYAAYATAQIYADFLVFAQQLFLQYDIMLARDLFALFAFHGFLTKACQRGMKMN